MATKTKQWSTGTGSATVQYGGHGDGQIIVASDPNSLYEGRSMQITVETTNGSPTHTKTITIKQAAKQRIDLSNAVVTASNQTYNGSAKTPTPTVTLDGNTIPSTGYDVSYSNNINAGMATITITGKGDYSGNATGTFTIHRAAGSVTTQPTSRDISYTGSSQSLITAGGGTGTMYYCFKLSTSSSWSSWSTSIPSATAIGTYSVQYYAGASTNYNASTTYSLTVEIKDYVDLGLPSGLKWAVGNITKSGNSYSIGRPQDYGCYYSWANTEGHMESEGYNWGTSPSDVYNYTPGHQQNGDISTSDSSHDMARACLGSPWHLPTKADVAELYDNTNMSEVTISGVKGRKFAKKTNSSIYMFIPYAGNGYGTGITDKASRFGCWTGTQYSASDANNLFANTSKVYREDHTAKARGYTVRAVK